jgi:3-deoxy-7-phosphoheptulonate synthase
MTTHDIENINVTAFDAMPTPEEIHRRVPITPKASQGHHPWPPLAAQYP